MSSSLLTKTTKVLICSSSGRLLDHHITARLLRLSLSTQSITQTNQQKQQEDIPFIARYLISSFGFSHDRALKFSTSQNLSLIKTPHQPDSVVQFLRKIGLSDAHIKSLVSFEPKFLSFSVNETLEPRSRELTTAGFTGELLVQLIRRNPYALSSKNTLSRLLFWRQFTDNNDELLLRIIRSNGLLIEQDINNNWLPKFNMLKEYGISQQKFLKILSRGRSSCVCRTVDHLKKSLERTEELGFARGSGMFIIALRVVGNFNKELWDKKVEFYKNTYGWSEEQVLSAFRKYPSLFTVANKTVETKMDFLVKEAAIDPKSLVSMPLLFGRSLEKCLVPRHRVLCILKEKGFNEKLSLSNVRGMSNKDFVEKFVEPYKEKIPELTMAYRAAYDGEEVLV